MTNKNSLLTGFYKTLFSIAIPIILQNLLQTFVNMIDTVMVGRLGEIAIASVGLGNQIFFMLIMVSFGVSSGATIFISQFWGAGDIPGIRKTFGIMLSVCFAVSLVFFAGSVLIPEKLLRLYTSDQAVISEGSIYLRIVAFSYPLFAIASSCQMSFRSTEHVVLPVVTTAVSFVTNVLLNAALIFGFEPLGIPRMGVAGAALATVISRLIETVITVSVALARKFEVMGKVRELLSFDRAFIIKLIKIASPVLISESLWGLGITTQNSIFSHAGTDSFAAFSIMNTVNQLTWVFFIGMGNASGIILGKKIGAGEEEGARAFAHRFCWFMPVMGAAIGILLFPLSRLLPFLFNVSPHIISISQSMMLVLMCMYPSRAFNMLIIVGICRSGGDTVFSFLIDNGWMWLLAIPLACAATFWWNCPAWQIMLCFETEQILKTLCGIWRVKSGKWLRNVTR